MADVKAEKVKEFSEEQLNKLKFATFPKKGTINTNKTLEIAKHNAEELGIRSIVIASTTGDTIKKAVKFFPPEKFNLVCVTHNNYFKDELPQEFSEDVRNELIKKGVKMVTSTLAFSGVGSALVKEYQFWDFTTLFARLIRTIQGDGIKVTMECALMATDAGKIEPGESVICIAGTGRGADTCCLIKTATSRHIEQLRLQIVLAKPL